MEIDMIKGLGQILEKQNKRKEILSEYCNLYPDEEIWQTVPEFAKYQVSSFGKVRKIVKDGILLLKLRQHANTGYIQINFSDRSYTKTFSLHRLVAELFIPKPVGSHLVDHINRNRQDNTVANLRWCTYTENSRNRTKKKNCSSKHLGVSWSKTELKWLARVRVQGKAVRLGGFKKERDAALAVNAAYTLYFKEFANLNDIK